MSRPRTRPFIDGLPYLTTKVLHPFLVSQPCAVTVQWDKDISIGIEVHPERLVFRYDVHREDGVRRIEERIYLRREPRNFGGAQLYFECPHCGRRVSKLRLVGAWFRCRQCIRLPYFSQSLGAEQRLSRTFARYRRKIDPNAGDLDFDDLPDKPKGMFWRTYNQLAGKAWETLDRRDEVMDARLYRVMARVLWRRS